MKMPILAFLLVLISLSGMASSADDATSGLNIDSGAEASIVEPHVKTVENDTTPTTVPSSATWLLIATGLIGLAGVSRRKIP